MSSPDHIIQKKTGYLTGSAKMLMAGFMWCADLRIYLSAGKLEINFRGTSE